LTYLRRAGDHQDLAGPSVPQYGKGAVRVVLKKDEVPSFARNCLGYIELLAGQSRVAGAAGLMMTSVKSPHYRRICADRASFGPFSAPRGPNSLLSATAEARQVGERIGDEPGPNERECREPLAGKASPKRNTPAASCRVGEMYCTNPMSESGRSLAPRANQ
jgi:hypothetical protein